MSRWANSINHHNGWFVSDLPVVWGQQSNNKGLPTASGESHNTKFLVICCKNAAQCDLVGVMSVSYPWHFSELIRKGGHLIEYISVLSAGLSDVVLLESFLTGPVVCCGRVEIWTLILKQALFPLGSRGHKECLNINISYPIALESVQHLQQCGQVDALWLVFLKHKLQEGSLSEYSWEPIEWE